MKAARTKIAEQAKQRDCTQRMETQWINVNCETMELILRLYQLQTNTARKPLAKTHSVLISDGTKLFDMYFELHKVVFEDGKYTITGNDNLSSHKDTVKFDCLLASAEDELSDREKVTSQSCEDEEKEVTSDDN